MKFLTSVTIVLSLPVLVTSFYGMNVNLPLQGHPLGFLVILVLTFVISLSAVYVFWKRDWF
jgi:magnesium transporter